MEREGHSPVAADHNGPTTTHFALEWMQPETWNVHVHDTLGRVQRSQLHPEPFDMSGIDS